VRAEPAAGVASRGGRDAGEQPSERLRRKIEIASRPFALACSSLFTHPRLKELLPAYFVRTHAIIRATVPLMEEGARRARAMADDDPIAAGVAEYLARHADEERDHDAWLLEDLELMGVDRGAVARGLPSTTVASLVGSQYYWTYHVHPVGQLGYISFMEGFPPSNELVDRLIEVSGYPRDAFRTFIEHGELDPHHRDELDEAIDALPLTAEHEALLGLSAISTAELLARSIEEVLEGA
jgi:heme oxygenase-like protein